MTTEIPQQGIPSNPQITIRLHPDEKQQAKAAANRDGVKSLATWIKHLMRQRIDEQQNRPEGG